MFSIQSATVGSLCVLLALGCTAVPKAESPEGSEAAESSESGKSETALTVGQPAPDFSLSSADEKTSVELSKLAGKVVIVDFWATWCDPCRESFPGYEKLAKDFEGKLAVVGVSVDEEPEGIADFGKSTGVTFPLVWDKGGKVAEVYGPPKMPTSYLIDQKGVLRHVHAGYTAGDEDKMRAEVEELLGK